MYIILLRIRQLFIGKDLISCRNRIPINSRSFMKLLSAALLVIALGGCLASTTSPIGVNCGGENEDKPLWEKPLACQGR
jgi:hypothetical protein